jgi:hypothetical protein
MLVQVLAAALLLLGSGLIFRALLAMERRPRPVHRPMARPAPPEGHLRRAA